ncbi:MAG TPA: Rieske 2Fe-2S domain-containing protein [Mycobacteriales bacterium]|nr:Rieske 2Fe-2S domain-containing protein [Mycobacteriales bacterium]
MRSLPPLDAAVEAIERAKALDPTVQATKKAIDAGLSNPDLRDALHGVWLGHPLHPALILVPMGSWVSASVLDFLPGRRDAARTLVGLGVVAVAPTALSGWADWSDLHPQQQRTGLVHAGANVVAAVLQFASWRARRQGRQARGVALSLAALSLGGASAYLGGHLAYRQGAGVNHAEEAPHVLPEEWTRLCTLDELPDGEPTRLTLDGVPVFVLRRDRHVDVLYDLCSHLSGPLSEGSLSGSGDELCVTCPWHGSQFRVRDGQVRRGPTTYPQPVLQVRVGADGIVQARLGEDD